MGILPIFGIANANAIIISAECERSLQFPLTNRRVTTLRSFKEKNAQKIVDFVMKW